MFDIGDLSLVPDFVTEGSDLPSEHRAPEDSGCALSISLPGTSLSSCASPKLVGEQLVEDVDVTASEASGNATPDLTFERAPPPSPTRSAPRSPLKACCAPDTDMQDAPLEASAWSRRRRGGGRRSISFSNVREHIKTPVEDMPASPELCGVQALLPRKCGMSVTAKLGEGTWGKVVSAINKINHSGTGQGRLGKASRIIHKLPRTGVQVVLKCVKKPACEGSSESEMLAREVLIHSRVDHVNIPRMFGYYEDEQNLMMILDLIAGQELKQVLVVRRTMPESEVRLIGLQVARALEHLHEMRVVHRDLTPRNILVGEGSKAWVIDLGLAVDLEVQDVGQIPLAGTMGYMPPEAQRPGALSSALDLWALGTVLYEALFGFAPFLPHELHLPSAHVQFPDPAWGINASDEVKDVLTSLLSKDPVHRLSAQALLTHAWAAPEAFAAIDALFAQDVAERAREHEDSEAGEQRQEEHKMLAVDVLGADYVGNTKTTMLPCATLLPRTPSRDEEMELALKSDVDCQSLTVLWSAVAWSSSARWTEGAGYGVGVGGGLCAAVPGRPSMSPLLGAQGSKTSTCGGAINHNFGALGLSTMRRSNSEPEIGQGGGPDTSPMV
jgi:aurora kinase